MDAIEHLVVMGVAGSGKTTVAAQVAEALGRPLAEADEFHSPANRALMTAGTPLTDADREPWLDALRTWMDEQATAGRSTVVACSALRRAYRDRLRRAAGRTRFIHLDGPPATIRARMQTRAGHFMPPALLDSQLATLEPLEADEDGVTLDLAQPTDALVAATLAAR